MKVLITGAGGLIGGRLCSFLLERGYSVVSVDNLFEGITQNIDSRSRFYLVDVLDQEKLNKVFEIEKPEIVFHLSCFAAEILARWVKQFSYNSNISALASVISCSLNNGVRKIVFGSSLSVYGHSTPPFTEDMPLSPADSYANGKAACEKELEITNSEFGLEYSIVRMHNVMGRGQLNSKYRNATQIWINQLINKQPLTVFSDGSQSRSFSDVKFILPPLETLISNHNKEVFNLGADKVYKIIDACETVRKVGKEFGFDSEIQFLPARKEVHSAWCDHSRAKSLLGFKDDTNLEETVREMIDWSIKYPQKQPNKLKYETYKDIPEYW